MIIDHSRMHDINSNLTDHSSTLVSLERIRQRLIDTTVSNRLIDCPLSQPQAVRLVDELPDQIYQRLIEGKTFGLKPVPAPTPQELLDEGYIKLNEESSEQIHQSYPEPDEWARHHGIDTSYDMPQLLGKPNHYKHTDDQLQTLLFPKELSAHLGRIHQLSQTASEESGANILYLALGFLEWYESPSSDVAHLSPLFVVPIDLTRSKQADQDGLYTYQLSMRDDDLMSNASLSQRLLADFDLTLPPVYDDSEPEGYLDTIEKLIKPQDGRWRVRSYASLCLLDFTSQLMYEDLNPDNWPSGKQITEHPLIQQLLPRVDNETTAVVISTNELTEHFIDDITNIHSDFPLIHSADSSQHSALIDAAEGKNLVIEGAPGTGKSQTITNLIAACLNKGRKVLFVSDKLAALQSVKNRLDTAGLGDFCLEIHSQKNSKLDILDSLMTSHQRRESLSPPTELNKQIQQYEEHKESLNAYTAKLNQPWKKTGLTPHQILQRATDFAERSPLDDKAALAIIDNPERISADYINQTMQTAEKLQAVYDPVARQTAGAFSKAHPWIGVRSSNLDEAQHQELIQALQQWTNSQQQLMERWTDLHTALGIDPVDAPNERTLSIWTEGIAGMPEDVPEQVIERIDEIKDNISSLEQLEHKRQEFRSRFSEIATDINSEYLQDEEHASSAVNALKTLRDVLGLTGTAPVGKAMEHSKQITALLTRFSAVRKDCMPLKGTLPPAFNEVFEPTKNALITLVDLLTVAEKLPPNLWRFRTDLYTDPEFRPALDHVESIVLNLRSQQAQLAQTYDMNQLPPSHVLEEIDRTINNHEGLGLLSKSFRAARNTLSQITLNGIKSATAANELTKLLNYQLNVESLTTEVSQYPTFKRAYRGLETNFEAHRELSDWYQLVDNTFPDDSQRQSPKAAALLNMSDQSATPLLRIAATDLRDRASLILNSLVKLQGIYPGFFASFTNNTSVVHPVYGLPILIEKLDTCAIQLDDSLIDPKKSITESLEQSNQWKIRATDHLLWTQTDTYKKFVPSLFDISTKPEVDDQQALAIVSTATHMGKLARQSPILFNAIRKNPTLTQLDKLREASPIFVKELKAAAKARAHFQKIASVDIELWSAKCNTLAESRQRNERALQQTDTLETWLSYQRVKTGTDLTSVSGLVQALESGALQSDDIPVAIQADLYRQLSQHMMQVDGELHALEGKDMQAIQTQFQQCDQSLMELQRKQVAAQSCRQDIPAGNSKGPVATFSEFSLIQREASKKRRHVSIQSLLSRAPGAVAALKPCFMMSPMAVAQYLQPGQYEFDIIIMHEASQIRTDAVLGAIARAKQLIVVGDSKQLTPTSFLSHLTDVENIDDTDQIHSANDDHVESILESATSLFDTRRLRSHYQSRHESLIGYSNVNFYDSRLGVFPSPYSANNEYGINLTRLNDATFNESINLSEAQRVVDILTDQIQLRPYESVGVIAMNAQQRDQIEWELERRLTSDEQLFKAYSHKLESDEPLFLKTIENVQGNERDVIIISMTYGPENSDEKTVQRFDTVDSDDGWRQLNVLLTRSRKRMEIVSSLGSVDIHLNNDSSQGIKSLRALLEYCETGHSHTSTSTNTERPPENAFEKVITRKLTAAGYQVEPQMGAAGFSIDIAVRNPDRPGEFLMGIMCDGATYHSAKSARDRDCLRQHVLEKLGWKIRHIWSTNWYQNPDAQLKSILNELRSEQTE